MSQKYEEVYAASLNRATERLFGQAIMREVSLSAQLDASAAQINDLTNDLREAREKVAAQGAIFETLAKRYPDDPELRHLVGFPEAEPEGEQLPSE